MLAVISPAKRLDFTSSPTTAKHSLPVFLKDSKQLIDVLREKSPAEIANLMSLSASLADLNYKRYGEWHTPFTPENARQAALAFSGDVYLGLDAQTLSDRDWTWAQKHLRILSGLYGLLKPLDLESVIYFLESLLIAEEQDMHSITSFKKVPRCCEAIPTIVSMVADEYHLL